MVRVRQKSKPRNVSREELIAIPCPRPKGEWHPVPNNQLLTLTDRYLADAGLRVTGERFVTDRNDQRMFAVLTIGGFDILGGRAQMQIGLRSSYDKSLAIGLAIGSHVIACSNMCFSGEIARFRKHTTFVLRDLPVLFTTALGKFKSFAEQQESYYERFLTSPVTDQDARSFILTAGYDKNEWKRNEAGLVVRNDPEPGQGKRTFEDDTDSVINSRDRDRVLVNWIDRKTLPEYDGENAWTLMQCFTRVTNQYGNPFTQAERTTRLTQALRAQFAPDLKEIVAVEVARGN